METLGTDERIKQFDKYKRALNEFIGFEDVKLIIDDKSETCYFSPNEKVVGIAGKWLNENKDNLDNAFRELVLKFGIFHEFSHYRDMIKECETTGNESMIKILTEIGKKSINYEIGGKKMTVKLWKIIHDLYNSVDDIVVNTEVQNYIKSEITKDDMESVYQKFLFVDYKDESKKQNVIEIRDRFNVYEKEPHSINIDGPVDYSKYPSYKAISYYYLRKYMVPNQEIILPPVLEEILLDHKGSPNIWQETYEKLLNIFNKKVKEAEKNNPRYEGLKEVISKQLSILNYINTNPNYINSLINKLLISPLKDGTYVLTTCGKKRKGSIRLEDRNIAGSLSLEDIIRLFTTTKGDNNGHKLVCNPDMRYELIQKIFEPIIVTLVLMELIDQEISKEDQESSNKDKGNEPSDGNSDNNENDSEETGGPAGDDLEDEDIGEDDEQGDAGKNGKRGSKPGKSSGNKGEGDGIRMDDSKGIKGKKAKNKGDDEELPDEIKKKIKEIKKIIEYKKERETEKNKRELTKKIGKSLSDILEDHGFTKEEAIEAKKLLDAVISNFSEEIKDFTEILEEELRKIEQEYIREYKPSIKGKKLDYNKLRKLIGENFISLDLEGERYMLKKVVQEAMQQDFKKLAFYFMLDVSGSTYSFRGEDGWLNGIAIAIAAALHNVEQKIRDMIGDPSYKIPINFIVYAGGATLIKTKNDDFKEMLAEANYKIIKMDGRTSDREGWRKSAEKLIEDFEENKSYVEDINEGKMKSFILQISDSDVTEDGVKIFDSELEGKYGKKTLEGIERKRLILGEKLESEQLLTKEELAEKSRLAFPPEVLKDPKTNEPIMEGGKYRVKLREIGLRKKSEITQNVKKLFDNLFLDNKKQ